MKEIYLPDIGPAKINKIIIFSNDRALLLGEYIDTGSGNKDEQVWTYFNPQTGKLTGY